VDWNGVWERYAPLIDRVGTRGEFSDLMWEMQGELGTSHAYEIGGDYRPQPTYPQGFLGADLVYDTKADAYRITHIVQGAPGEPAANSPLNGPGINARVGEKLRAINGRRLSRELLPQELLVHQADSDVILTLEDDSGQQRNVTVKALKSEHPARYREWVETNRRRVHEEGAGRVGYVHIPDMSARGYAEFHRLYLAEVAYDAMIVDVRYNGGGHVSQLLIEKLARKRVGYDVSRWGQPEPYPNYSVVGPLVAITNQWAGSDGDIFCHVFKLMRLGPLIGKRTWGGVIGIWPRNLLADGSITTQPEFSFWFQDVGWGVENYGTDPDIEIDIAPQDYADGRDSQLDRAIALALERLDAEPVAKPSFADRPNLAPPPLLGSLPPGGSPSEAAGPPTSVP
jgi:tricorn protease